MKAAVYGAGLERYRERQMGRLPLAVNVFIEEEREIAATVGSEEGVALKRFGPSGAVDEDRSGRRIVDEVGDPGDGFDEIDRRFAPLR